MDSRRINRLAQLAKMKEDLKSLQQDKGFVPFSAQDPTQEPAKTKLTLVPDFNSQAAQSYNSKSKQLYQKQDADIKRLLNTSSDWESPEFAQAVYDWQGKNGFSGKWVDGKLGPATMSKMAKSDSAIAQSYDAFEHLKGKHANDKPYPKVLSLMGEVQAVQQRMNATDIPLSMLMGWMQVESGGRVSDVTTSAGFKEMGLFQVSEAEAASIGADHDRLTSDVDYSIEQGIKLTRYHESNLASTITQYYTKGSDMYWRFVFLGFVAGDGFVRQLISQMAASGQAPKDWNEVLTFAQHTPYIGKHSTAKWTYHVDRAFNLGNQMAPQQTNVAELMFTKRLKRAKRKARTVFLGEM